MEKHNEGKLRVTVVMEQSRQAPNFSMLNHGQLRSSVATPLPPVTLAYLVSLMLGML